MYLKTTPVGSGPWCVPSRITVEPLHRSHTSVGVTEAPQRGGRGSGRQTDANTGLPRPVRVTGGQWGR